MSLQDDIMDNSRLQLTGDFDSQVAYLLDNVRLTRSEVEHLKRLFIDLENTMTKEWPGCTIHPFGSIVTGLGIRTSDVDCYISLPHWEQTAPSKVVMIAKSILKREYKTFTQLFAIPKAKVPIVKFYHIPTERQCDINFKSPSGVENSSLIAYLLHIDSRILPLTILIKYWAKIYNMTGTNLMSNYALTMLVIFYLQEINILPPIHILQRNVQKYIIDNWNTAFEEINYTTSNDKHLYQLLGGFFDYYNNFDFERYIISPFVGYPINKSLFKDMNDIPEEFDLYKTNIRDKVCQQLNLDTKICIQDPFEHSRNCGFTVHASLALKFVSFFKQAAKMFREERNNNFLKQLLTGLHVPEMPLPIIQQNNKKPPRKIVKRKQKNNFTKRNWGNLQVNIQALYGEYSRLLKRS